MKFNRNVAAAGVAAACAWIGNASAAGSATVSVTVAVAAQCIFNSGGAVNPISFAYDGSAATPTLTHTTTAFYRCTNGTTPSFTVGSTAAGLVFSGNTITYSAGVTPNGNGGGMATSRSLIITASLDQTTADLAAPGNYTGSFTITLSP